MGAAVFLVLLLQGTPGAVLGADLGARAEALERLLKCSCKDENWTRTLESCTSSCADPQKREIRDLLAAGRTEAEILDRMRAKFGPKVLARADVGSNLAIYVLPFLALLGGATYLVLRLKARAVPATPPAPAAPSPGQAALEAEIEEELARIE